MQVGCMIRQQTETNLLDVPWGNQKGNYPLASGAAKRTAQRQEFIAASAGVEQAPAAALLETRPGRSEAKSSEH